MKSRERTVWAIVQWLGVEEDSSITCFQVCERRSSEAGVCWQIFYRFYLLSVWDNGGLPTFNRNLWPSEWYLKDSMMHLITKHSSWLVLIWSLEDSAPSDWEFLKMPLSPYGSCQIPGMLHTSQISGELVFLRMYELYNLYFFGFSLSLIASS